MVSVRAINTLFQSTLSVRRATRLGVMDVGDSTVISIHALRKESDDNPVFHRPEADAISIHALRKESDLNFHKATPAT